MEELIKNLNSISWWVTVVIAGIIISLISSYIKIGIDKIIYKISARNRKKKKLEFEKLIKKANLHPKSEFDLTVLNFAATRNYIKGLHFHLLNIFLLLFAFLIAQRGNYLIVIPLIIMSIYIANTGLKLIRKSIQQIELFSYIYNSKSSEKKEDILF